MQCMREMDWCLDTDDIFTQNKCVLINRKLVTSVIEDHNLRYYLSVGSISFRKFIGRSLLVKLMIHPEWEKVKY